MKKNLFVKNKVSIIIAFFITLLVISLSCVLVFNLLSHNNEQAESATLVAVSNNAESTREANEIVKISPLNTLAALGTENLIVIGILAGIGGVVVCGVAGVAAKSAKQTRDNAKEAEQRKGKEKNKEDEVIVVKDLESEGFDDDTSDNVPIKEEPIAEEPVEEIVEEPIEEVAEEPVIEEKTEEIAEEPAEEVASEVIEEETVAPIESETEESADEEENGEVFTFMHGDKIVKVRFLRSFTAKLIQSDELVQSNYTDLKNHVLGYKGVKDRMSFPYDSINKGRQQLVKFVFRGKRLCVYCALDPAEVPETWHTETSEHKRYQNVPVFIRIKGTTTFGRAIKMIDMVCEKYGLQFIEDQNVDYRMPYETDEPLIERNLIKVYSDGDGDIDNATIIKAKFGDKTSSLVKDTENLPEEIDEDAIEDNDEDDEAGEVITYNDGDRIVKIRLMRSFTAKLIQAEELVQDSYATLKNHVLGYKEAKDRISFPYDSINKGRQQLVKFVIRGKRLCVYCALDPDEVPETWHTETSIYKRYQNVPVFVRIKGSVTFERARKMIDLVCKKYGLTFVADQNVDYRMSYEPNEPLIERNLIKVYADGDIDGATLVTAKYGESLNNTEDTPKESEAVEESPENLDLDEDGEENEVITITDDGKEVRVKMVRSFTAKLIQSDDDLKNYYDILKNHTLGFENASARMSFPYDSINYGKHQLVKFVIRGKSLFVYCALNPEEITESWHAEITTYKRYQNVPVSIQIKGSTTLDIAKRMINQACRNYSLKFTGEQNIDYKLPFEDNATLIDKKLIKIYSDTEINDAMLQKIKARV